MKQKEEKEKEIIEHEQEQVNDDSFEELPEMPKHLLPIFITGGTVNSTLCGWVYFHDLKKSAEDKMEQEEEEEEGEEKKKEKELTPIFASKSHTAAINCLDSYGKMCASGGYDETVCIYDMVLLLSILKF